MTVIDSAMRKETRWNAFMSQPMEASVHYGAGANLRLFILNKFAFSRQPHAYLRCVTTRCLHRVPTQSLLLEHVPNTEFPLAGLQLRLREL